VRVRAACVLVSDTARKIRREKFWDAGGPGRSARTNEAGESEALIFTKVDRASRCTEDFARLIRLSDDRHQNGDRHAQADGAGRWHTWPLWSPSWSAT
jgi:hypothetical protein